MIAAAMLLPGCDQTGPAKAPPSSAPAYDEAKPVLWKRVHDATVIAVSDAETTRALTKAVADAKQSVSDARQRWAIAKPAERSLWAVKWAAPVAGDAADDPGGCEHVWVQPVNWSPFRIEGILLSSPTTTLECGRTRDEMVSFPVDELSDWIHFASEASDAAFEGGFTVRVLEDKYGRTVQ